MTYYLYKKKVGIIMQITPIGLSVNQNKNTAFKAQLNIKYAEDASIKLQIKQLKG